MKDTTDKRDGIVRGENSSPTRSTTKIWRQKTTKLKKKQNSGGLKKLDLVSCGHALVLTVNIVALFVWDGQHLDVLDCSLISLAGSGGDAGYMGSSILRHLMALAWTPSCLSMGAPDLGPWGRPSSYFLESEILSFQSHRSLMTIA